MYINMKLSFDEKTDLTQPLSDEQVNKILSILTLFAPEGNQAYISTMAIPFLAPKRISLMYQLKEACEEIKEKIHDDKIKKVHT